MHNKYIIKAGSIELPVQEKNGSFSCSNLRDTQLDKLLKKVSDKYGFVGVSEMVLVAADTGEIQLTQQV